MRLKAFTVVLILAFSLLSTFPIQIVKAVSPVIDSKCTAQTIPANCKTFSPATVPHFDALIVLVGVSPTQGAGPACGTMSVTDTIGNSFTVLGDSCKSTGLAHAMIAYANNTGVGNTDDTITVSISGCGGSCAFGTHGIVRVYAVNGLSLSVAPAFAVDSNAAFQLCAACNSAVDSVNTLTNKNGATFEEVFMGQDAGGTPTMSTPTNFAVASGLTGDGTGFRFFSEFDWLSPTGTTTGSSTLTPTVNTNIYGDAVAGTFAASAIPPAVIVTIVGPCNYFQLQCWWYPMLFMSLYSGFFLFVAGVSRTSPKGAMHLFLTGLTFGSLVAVIFGIMNIVFPLILLLINTLYVLRSKR